MYQKEKKYIQIITDKVIWEKWLKLAEGNGMPLVTYIKHLINKELNK
jgi:hypothetical protein